MKNLKKPIKVLIFAGIALDVAITVFLFVLSIIMLAKTAGKTANEIENATGFIGYLQHHPLLYGLAFVVPLFFAKIINLNRSIFRSFLHINDKSNNISCE